MADEKVDAWMPLWIGSYLADTMTLTTQQHGAYLLLLFAYWRNRGPLDDDDEDLASIVKASASEWKKLRAKLTKFFTIEGGTWAHTRADKELAAAGLRKAAAVSKAKAGAEARWGKKPKQGASDAPSIPEAVPAAVLGHCPTPPPSPLAQTEPDGSACAAHEGAADAGDLPPDPPQGTAYGLVCRAIRQAGIPDAAPHNPRFRNLVDAGATAEEFIGFAKKALTTDHPFAYVLGAVEGERKRAAQNAGALHRGPMPAANRQQAIEDRNRSVADEWLAQEGATT